MNRFQYISLLLILFMHMSAFCQSHSTLFIKSRPIALYLGNPNISGEVLVNKRYSYEFDIELNRNAFLQVFQGESGFYDANGFTASLVKKFYFTKFRKAPNCLYLAAIVQYTKLEVEQVKVNKTTWLFSSWDEVNFSSKGPSFGGYIGKKLFLRSIFIEGTAGFGYYLETKKEEVVYYQYNPFPFGDEQEYINARGRWNTYITLAIGYSF